jgi:3-deoxy-manno-octulosonate cytidylyltransferase (CMP-KDO synthetase)
MTLSPALAELAKQLLVVIPARYASVRFPGKPLALIHGKPMVLHTLQRAQESLLGQHCPIVVATEDERIASVVRQAGGTVMMTSDQHHSGTDRVWEVAQAYPDHPYVLNLQGDEPMMPSTCLEALLESLARWQNVADVLTLVTPLAAPNASVAELEAHWADPAQVKAILASSGQALYFTRALAPHIREERLAVLSNLEERAKLPLYRHLGLYLYKRSVLEAFVKAPPSPLELMERLEQLRGLEMGFSFYAGIVPSAPTGVDTPSDLEQIAQLATAMGLG